MARSPNGPEYVLVLTGRVDQFQFAKVLDDTTLAPDLTIVEFTNEHASRTVLNKLVVRLPREVQDGVIQAICNAALLDNILPS